MKRFLSSWCRWRKAAVAALLSAVIVCLFGGYVHAHFSDITAIGDYVLLVMGGGWLYFLIMRHGWNYTVGIVAVFLVCVLGVDTSIRFLGISFVHGAKITIRDIAIFVSGTVGLYLLFRRTKFLEQQTKALIKQTTYLAQQTKNQTEETAYLAQQTKDQTAQTAIQIRRENDQKFNAAIASLGSAHVSARTGAIHSLYHLARDDHKTEKKYFHLVPELLCSHIRDVTGGAQYQKEYALKPSSEIQMAINMLFRYKGGDLVGLYHFLGKNEGKLARADLSGAYLVGAKFVNMDLQYALFTGANCVNTCFWDSNCQRVSFHNAAMQSAWFLKANCQGASFQAAHCQFMKMEIAKCQFANFAQAQCQDAKLSLCKFGGTNFSNSGFQGAYVVESNFYDAFADTMGGSDLADYTNPSWRIGKGTRLVTVKSAGEVPESDIARIQKMQPMLSAVTLVGDSTSIYDRLQEVIQKNAGRLDKFVFPKTGNHRGAAEGKAAEDAQKIVNELALLDDKFRSDV